MKGLRLSLVHLLLWGVLAATLLPFAFMVNSALRDTREFYHTFFALPDSLLGLLRGGGHGETRALLAGPTQAWTVMRPYVLNSVIVCALSAFGVCLLGSSTAYILARHRFFGRDALYSVILATMVFPSVLTLVPSFLLVKQLHLLNTYWAMILPYVAGGQVFAIFVFRSFFLALPEELFEAARLEGAGHWALYRHIVLPLSRPVFAVILIMNIVGTWNNFLWPYIVNTDDRHQVIAAGLYTMATSPVANNTQIMFSAYVLSSIPLLVLFLFATKPFIEGMTSGALKG